ncbi:MAG: HpaII family restriction endonuclease [Amylibacter sp.]|nr:HpaII family restriction endonuclease [Amylibacter sp.]
MTKESKGKNKGEWSELYAFIKILADGELPSANDDLSSNYGKIIKFKSVIVKGRNGGNNRYVIDKKIIKIYDSHGILIDCFNRVLLAQKAANLAAKILKGKGSSFKIPEAVNIQNELHLFNTSAGSKTKADLEAVIFDVSSNAETRLGFSIKSFLGGNPTDLNASRHTQYIYHLPGMDANSAKTINEINTKNKLADRFKAIFNKCTKIQYCRMQSVEFERNIKKLDTMMPEFLAFMAIERFRPSGKKRPIYAYKTVGALTKALSRNKGLHSKHRLSYDDYKYKIKLLLEAVSLGMVPSEIWNGYSKAKGGFLIVKNSGEIVYFSIFDRDRYLDYLFNNMIFETPSSSPKTPSNPTGKNFPYSQIFCRGSNRDMFFVKITMQLRFEKGFHKKII